MELFKLFGTIAISNSEANQAMDESTEKAKSSSQKIGDAFAKINGVIGKVAKIALATGTAAITKITKDAIGAYGDYEQLVGGVETLFKNSSSKVMEFANKAYKTAGLSANDYMETVTSFSASLLQGLGGDTEKAADIADMAIKDMADNANKMGTSIESIQNAYQGFAKQNYTMLDNLKLGYGGTQSEMIRLINDSGVLNKKIKDLDGISFDTMIQAIHKVQENMDITGTTAKEASSTIQGSWSSLKASWQNLMTGLADENADIGELIKTVGENAKTVWDNVTPHIKTVFDNLISLLPDWAQNMVNTITDKISTLGDKVQDLTQFFKDHKTAIENIAIVLGVLFGALELANMAIQISNVILPIYTALTTGASLSTTALGGAVAFLTSPITLVILAIAALIAVGILLWKNWDTIKEKAGELKDKISEKWDAIKEAISNKIEEIKERISEIFNNIKETISNVFETIKNIIQVAIMFIVELFSAYFQLITLPFRFIWENCKEYVIQAWEYIKTKVSEALNAISSKISTVWNAILGFLESIFTAYKNIVDSNWNFIKNIIASILDGISSKISAIWNAIVSFLEPILNTIKEKISNTFNNIKTSVTDKVNSIKETMKNKFDEAKTNVINIFDKIKTGINDKIEAAKTAVKNGIDKIKSFFNFSWSLPHLKTPHFSITGSFSLNPPSVPKIGVEWYKNGGILEGIMTEPTVFGFNPKTGAARVGGEAGAEAITPIDRLMDMIRQANNESNSGIITILNSILNLLGLYGPQFVELIKEGKYIVLDDGTLVGATIGRIDEALQERIEYGKRGN